MDYLSLGLAIGSGLIVAIYVISGITVVNEWERRPVLRFGKYLRTLSPGVSWIEPITNRVQDCISIQDEVVQLQMENVQTHDNVPVAFTLVMTTKIRYETNYDGVKDVFLNVDDGDKALKQKAVAVVSEMVSGTELDTILHERTALYGRIVDGLQERVSHWGYKILAVEIKDIGITDSTITEAISLKARAQKEGEAELVRATLSFQTAQALKKAADVYDDNTRWLKQQEVLIELGRSAENNTIMLPIDYVGRISVAVK